jgi:DNA-3-methyladenine glycosylase I
MKRCAWCPDIDIYLAYHDREWGVPVHDDRIQFEFLVLEAAQAGLSWLTVLRKRDAYRAAYEGFDIEKVARFTEKRIAKMLENPGIIRNRLKIESSVNNARRVLEVRREFGSFDAYLWSFVNGKPLQNRWKSMSQLPPKTELSDRISKDLKSRGFRFVGSTIIYSHLQAVGIVNDHTTDCFRYKEVAALG